MMRNFSAKEAEFDERVIEIARANDRFEGYRHPHAARIAALADALAKRFNLAAHDCYVLRQAALVHDLGEALMNRDYIKNNARLREDESVDMQRHTIIGEQETAKRELPRAVQLLVRWHHEWWNGTGYPDALEAEQIPLAARILRVADTYSAMTDARPHRAAFSEAEAKRRLTEWAGIEFDPQIVKMFLSLENIKELKASAEVRERKAEAEKAEETEETEESPNAAAPLSIFNQS